MVHRDNVTKIQFLINNDTTMYNLGDLKISATSLECKFTYDYNCAVIPYFLLEKDSDIMPDELIKKFLLDNNSHLENVELVEIFSENINDIYTDYYSILQHVPTKNLKKLILHNKNVKLPENIKLLSIKIKYKFKLNAGNFDNN